jgi:hypothetical protein
MTYLEKYKKQIDPINYRLADMLILEALDEIKKKIDAGHDLKCICPESSSIDSSWFCPVHGSKGAWAKEIESFRRLVNDP